MDSERFHVIEALRRPNGKLFSGPSVAACLEWVVARSCPGATRVAI